ncbi:hypothetical protein LUZ61_016882 [Rhynchospora tenuis]|uniref:ATP-dependent RNA helicase n=1 Tax=Rhynchospora tenuis TaxID=198213 RepID=A0AAD5Z6D8_9POAL|nr:hypothetical protein LUZ61_016882 [Rhynchospora tenuis]
MKATKREKRDTTEKKSSTKEEDTNGLFASCSFSDLGLHASLCDHLQDKMGFQRPTKIQAEAIPVVISGRHALVKAATGTGKTLVYLAPIIHLMQMRTPRIDRSDGTFALVLVPTRELCMQVYGIAQKLVHRFHWLVPGYIMGGENRAKEKARLRKGISILIATPGRLLDHLKNTSSFNYSSLQWIVFDEADMILELGFGKALEEILAFLGSRTGVSNQSGNKKSDLKRSLRQNLLLSATLNEKVNQLANISLDNPVRIGLDEMAVSLENEELLIKDSADTYNLPEQLLQRYVKVPCGSRLSVLLSVLKALFEREASQKVVVFLSTCDGVDFHHALLTEFELQVETNRILKFLNCTVLRLHGNMKQEDRAKAFQGFKTEKSALLLSTDVAARGLDFPKVRCIIQYDSPGEASEYVHRVGRTARLGEKGEALLFLQPVETDYLRDLELHGVSLKEYPLEKILDSFPLLQKGMKNPYKKKMVSLDMHPWIMFLQRALESFVSSEPSMTKLARDAFCSWVGAYNAHRGELKKIFVVKKLHLGHVARSFGLKEQPSLVGRVQANKRKREDKKEKLVKRRKVVAKKYLS